MYDRQLLEIVVVFSVLLAAFAFFLVLFILRHKNHMYRHKLDKQRLLFEIERKELNMCFQERELILAELSQDIHDNIGQIAHLIRMHLHNIEERCAAERDHEMLKMVKVIAPLTERIINETRHMGHTLNGNFIKSWGLYRMLEYDTEVITAAKKLQCRMEVNGNHKSLSAETQLLVYRIAQEAIHNILQHAHAKNLLIKLSYKTDIFNMVISDDGIGFNAGDIDERKTQGFSGMRKRARLLGGTLNIISDYKKGCSIALAMNMEHTV